MPSQTIDTLAGERRVLVSTLLLLYLATKSTNKLILPLDNFFTLQRSHYTHCDGVERKKTFQPNRSSAEIASSGIRRDYDRTTAAAPEAINHLDLRN